MVNTPRPVWNWASQEQHCTIKSRNMAYNRFYLNTLLRIVILSATNLGFFYFLMLEGRFFTTLFLGLLFVIQVILLFVYINVINLNLSRFLLMLGEEETVIIPLKTKVERTFGGLQHSFDRLNREMSKARLEKEYAAILMQHVIDHLGSGLLAWDTDGNIELINDAGLDLLGLSELNNIRKLNDQYPGLYDWLLKIIPAGKGSWNLESGHTKGQKASGAPLSFRIAGFQLGDRQITLVSFQNISDELEETEMQSWEKLIRVLTHEVSNSVTPITTLGSNIRKRVKASKTQKSGEIILTGDLAVDIERSAELIEQRGNGLIDFISQYKTFMRLPEPDIRDVSLKDLIEDACKLGENLDSTTPFKITCNTVRAGLICRTDRKMMEQVLLNLIRNALDSIPMEKEGHIEISGSSHETGYAWISVKDNGIGIPPELLDQVFVPFFTTRAKGSGIGLSFCRRVLNMNGGKIMIESTSDSGTIIKIYLPVLEL